MDYLLALAPIATVLVLMAGLRWGTHKAGAAGFLVALLAGSFYFGLTPRVLWISQAKGLLLSIYVLAVMWPALFLFHWLNSLGAIEATARALRRSIHDPKTCALVLAWPLSGSFEGIAGFGLPVAIVSPMLVAIGVTPVQAVAAVAIGHAWAVTFGSMGMIFQTLISISGMEPATLAPAAALILGFACVGCGWATARLLQIKVALRFVLPVGLIMAAVQYFLCAHEMTSIGSLGAGAAGLAASLLLAGPAKAGESVQSQPVLHKDEGARLRRAIYAYGALAAIMALLSLLPALRNAAEHVAWKPSFPEAKTANGFVTAAGGGATFRPFTHPGSVIAVVAFFAVLAECVSRKSSARETLVLAGKATVNSGGIASIGILVMVGISVLMDHCGMTLLLAHGVSRLAGAAYPAVSALIGVLGAFATGSNNNSNIMFATLQKDAALFLHLSPALMLAAQTAGGSLGSMVAPAKLVIGCSTAGLDGQEGLVLRKTLPPMFVILAAVGALVLLLASAYG